MKKLLAKVSSENDGYDLNIYEIEDEEGDTLIQNVFYYDEDGQLYETVITLEPSLIKMLYKGFKQIFEENEVKTKKKKRRSKTSTKRRNI